MSWKIRNLFRLIEKCEQQVQELKIQQRRDFSDLVERINDNNIQNRSDLKRFEQLYPQKDFEDDEEENDDG